MATGTVYEDFVGAFHVAVSKIDSHYHSNYDTKQGCLKMGWDLHTPDVKERQKIGFMIYNVNVSPEKRRQGIFKNFLHYIAAFEDGGIHRIGVLAVGSWKLINMFNSLQINGIRFIDHGGDYIWARDGICCKRTNCNRLNWKPYKLDEGCLLEKGM